MYVSPPAPVLGDHGAAFALEDGQWTTRRIVGGSAPWVSCWTCGAIFEEDAAGLSVGHLEFLLFFDEVEGGVHPVRVQGSLTFRGEVMRCDALLGDGAVEFSVQNDAGEVLGRMSAGRAVACDWVFATESGHWKWRCHRPKALGMPISSRMIVTDPGGVVGEFSDSRRMEFVASRPELAEGRTPGLVIFLAAHLNLLTGAQAAFAA